MRFWLLLCLCVASSQAAAGLFADDDARKQLKQLEARTAKLEQALAAAEKEREQNIASMLDLQMQLETLNSELRKLRGQNEELAHNLESAEKRQKDFYIDLDTRLRRVESGEAGDGREASADPVGENREFEAAYTLYKRENYRNAAAAFQDFLKHYPQSFHEANVRYWMGNAYFLSKDCKSSVSSYKKLIEKFPDHPRAPEAMFNSADCQLSLKQKTAARQTLKQLISRFPGSDAAEKAKKRLASIK